MPGERARQPCGSRRPDHYCRGRPLTQRSDAPLCPFYRRPACLPLRGDCRRPSNGCVFAVQDGVSDFGDLSSPARWSGRGDPPGRLRAPHPLPTVVAVRPGDRKSTRLNSSHANISYAVFCLIKNIRTSPFLFLYPNLPSTPTLSTSSQYSSSCSSISSILPSPFSLF